MSYETTLELAQLAEKELGHDLSGASSQRGDIIDQLDYAHKVILGGGGILNYDENNRRKREDVIFNWALESTPKILTLRPAITDVNVTVNRESTSVTFGAAPDGANSVNGWFIRVGNEQPVYQIVAHTAAATTATLDASFIGSANASAASCEIFKLQYDIGSSDVLRLVAPLRLTSASDGTGEIPLVDKEELYRESPIWEAFEGPPCMAAMIVDNEGTLTVQFDNYPADLVRIEVDYIAIPDTLVSGSVNPIIPKRHRNVISYVAAYYLALRNNDPRANFFLQIARNKFIDMIDQNDHMFSTTDQDFGRIKTRRVRRRMIDVIKPYV